MTNPRLAAVAVLVVGAALRLYQLTLRPFHHDEGVNGFFLARLVNEGAYKYDPSNYHGPSLYYFTLPLVQVLGLHSYTLRLLTALFGIGLIVLALCLGRRMGAWAAVAAAVLLAVSPGMVFISRYYIHEMMVLFFMLGIVVALDAYGEHRATAWLMAASASAGLLVATKETAAPMMVVLLIAWGMTRAWMAMAGGATAPMREGGRTRKKGKGGGSAAAEKAPATAPEGRGALPDLSVVVWALVVFLGINVALYSSFRTNPDGVVDALRAFAFWTRTGETAHVHPFTQYIIWMLRQEAGVLVLGTLGIAFALARRPNRLVVFAAFWALGMFSMYSIIKYKTPWLTVNIVLPFAITGGYAVQEIGRLFGRAAGIAVCAVALVLGLGQSARLNFVHYDDNADENVYVYAHTVRDIRNLLTDIDTLAARGAGAQTRILIVTPTYWPLPWYLKDYKNAQFFGKMTSLDGVPLVVAEPAQEAAVMQASGGTLRPVRNYTLRPGVTLVLWARTDSGSL